MHISCTDGEESQFSLTGTGGRNIGRDAVQIDAQLSGQVGKHRYRQQAIRHLDGRYTAQFKGKAAGDVNKF